MYCEKTRVDGARLYLLIAVGLLTIHAARPYVAWAQVIETPVRARAHTTPLPAVSGTIVASGDGYQVLESDVPADEQSAKRAAVQLDAIDPDDQPVPGVHRTIHVFSPAGLQAAPLPAGLKSDLALDFSDSTAAGDTEFHPIFIDEAAAADAYARSTEQTPRSSRRKISSLNPCKKKHELKSRSVSYALPPGRSQLPITDGGFAGSFESTWNSNGQISMTLYYIKKSRCGITYGVEFDRVVAEGNLDLTGSELKYTGTVYRLPETTVSRATLVDISQSYSFWAGPVLFIISAGLQLDAGLNVGAEVQASVGLRTPITGRYSFMYECRSAGCTTPRPAEHTLTGSFNDAQFIGDISARANVTPWLQLKADVAGGVYISSLQFAQVAVSGALTVPAELWGYYGNACGDADGDGYNETVSAVTLDVNADIAMSASIEVLGKSSDHPLKLGLDAPWELLPEDLSRGSAGKYTYRRNVAFQDLLGGSSALTPIVIAAPTVSAAERQEASYTFRVRPCVPSLGKNMNYQVGFGNEAPVAVAGPRAGATVSHTWAEAGTQTLSASLATDSQGRAIHGAATSRVISVERADSSNRAPLVSAGEDRFLANDRATTLVGTASDPDGDAISYRWTQTSGPQLTLSGTETTSVTVQALGAAPGAATLVLTATDAYGATAVDEVTLTIFAPKLIQGSSDLNYSSLPKSRTLAFDCEIGWHADSCTAVKTSTGPSSVSITAFDKDAQQGTFTVLYAPMTGSYPAGGYGVLRCTPDGA